MVFARIKGPVLLSGSLKKPWLVFGLVSLLPLMVYIRTLAPTITWSNAGADSGDLAAAIAVDGVPHPPGYPAYLVLGEFFQRLPVGDVAYRLNLLSATCAALTVLLTGLYIYRMLLVNLNGIGGRQNWAYTYAISASLSLAFSGLFWSQAVIAEVYMLNLLLAAALLYGAFQVKPTNQNWLVPGIWGLLGLGLGNHLSLVFIIPGMLAGTVKIRWSRALIQTALLAFCAGLSIYLVIPLRAAAMPPINWGIASSWSGFWWLVSAAPYRQFLFGLPWQFVPARIFSGLQLLAETFLWWGFPVGWLGLVTFARRYPSLACRSLASFCLFFIYAIGYNTSDSYVYLLPAMLIFSLWLGWGLYRLGEKLHEVPVLSRSYPAILVCLALVPLWLNFTMQDKSQGDEAFTYARQLLEQAETGAVVVAESDAHTFALWYLRYGLGIRPDVAVINNHLLIYPWYQENLRRTHPGQSPSKFLVRSQKRYLGKPTEFHPRPPPLSLKESR